MRVYRIYRDDGLMVRVKRRKKLVSQKRIRPSPARRLNERWCLDFVADRMSDGRPYPVFTAIDAFSRESLALRVAWTLPAKEVTKALDAVIARRGRPEVITVDNGTEFTSNHFAVWAYSHDIEIDFISPGRPVENAHIESFNGRLRDECLNSYWFAILDEARGLIEYWRRDYNERRPHSSLRNLTPEAFAAWQAGYVPACQAQESLNSSAGSDTGSRARSASSKPTIRPGLDLASQAKGDIAAVEMGHDLTSPEIVKQEGLYATLCLHKAPGSFPRKRLLAQSPIAKSEALFIHSMRDAG
jgi:putative transposase